MKKLFLVTIHPSHHKWIVTAEKLFSYVLISKNSLKMNSLFVLNQSGKIIIEKHWRGIISRQVVDYFNDQVVKFQQSNIARSGGEDRDQHRIESGGGSSTGRTREDMPPVIETTRYQLLNVFRDGLTWLCPVEAEVEPLLVFEFIHRIIDVLNDYLGEVSEAIIKENFVTVYQLLEEMMDYGFPNTTEPNVLREYVLPPTIINRVVTAVGGVAGITPKLNQNGISSIPWRQAGVKYTNNEIYFDLVEEIDAIIDSNGAMVSCEANGALMVNCRLSGMPDLTLNFVNPRLLDDASFHPCVRYQKYETDKVLSFVPPDGHFKLMSYRVNLPHANSLPVQVKPQLHATKNGGKFDISIHVRSTEGRPIENLLLVLPLAKSTTGINATCNLGSYMFDPVTKTVRWDVGKITGRERIPVLSGTFSSSDENPETGHAITLDFQINSYTVSGLKVDALRIYHENYKPYKGVRSLTKAGKLQIRT